MTLQKISIRRATFKQSNPDRAIKQQPIKIIYGSNFKLKETACEMWNLIIILPLMLGEPIIEENNCVSIYLIKFCILVERLCDFSFSNSDLIILDFVFEEFFDTYYQLFPYANMKPKSRYLRHYSEIIKRFGPLAQTLRFEAKHQHFR